MSETPHIYIVAAEPSGEQLGAALIKHIRDLRPKAIDFSGIGGPAMQAQGIISPIDIAPLSLLGLLDGLKNYGQIMDLVRQAVCDIMAKAPQMVVLIDSWGFMIRVADRLKKQGYAGKIVKYVAPQVWAMRPGRAKTLARNADHLLSIQSFDAPYFEAEGLSTQYVGNPVFDKNYRSGDGDALREALSIPKNAPLCGVFFGSRLSELNRLAAPFAEAVLSLKQKVPDVHFVSPLSDNIATQVRAVAGQDQRLNEIIFLPEARKLDVFAAATAALACSGTVTTQLACAGVPTVLAYKLGRLTYPLVAWMYRPEYVGMVNIASGEELIPEFLQKRAIGTDMAEALIPFLTHPEIRAKRSAELIAQTDKMRGGQGSASEKAARALLDLLI